MKYAEYMAAYIVYRKKGESHEEALDSLHALLRGIGVPS
jgi:hypothetical protein